MTPQVLTAPPQALQEAAQQCPGRLTGRTPLSANLPHGLSPASTLPSSCSMPVCLCRKGRAQKLSRSIEGGIPALPGLARQAALDLIQSHPSFHPIPSWMYLSQMHAHKVRACNVTHCHAAWAFAVLKHIPAWLVGCSAPAQRLCVHHGCTVSKP